jgi:hypothetical protein
MDDHITQLTASAERLASAAEALEQALVRLDEQQQALNAKVDRIVAAVSEDERPPDPETQRLRERVTELERANAALEAAHAAPAPARKTLPPLVSALLAKNGMETADAPAPLDPALLEKTLSSLSLEQRIAVKAEMARAGLID